MLQDCPRDTVRHRVAGGGASLDCGSSLPLSASRLAEKEAGAGVPIPLRTRQGSPTAERQQAAAVQGWRQFRRKPTWF